jgi:acetoin:2,6-dichlorophenolindophenol oxidoreductase subunit beta
MSLKKYNYGSAICSAFEYLLENYPEVFVIGQGLWSPWYVGNSMTDLDKKFGKQRVIDTPVSESATTGAAVGASLTGMRPIVVHPRMDFMIYAMDSIVNQAAKWSSMFGGQANPSLTIRSIINRGGEQGAQHSQALHAWFAHVPGLRVVMPSSVADARDLLIASVLCDDPVMYIDDRWLYEQEDNLPPVEELSLQDQGPKCIIEGADLTIVGSGFTTFLAQKAAKVLLNDGIEIEVIDLRILNPFDSSIILKSVEKTGHLLVVDSGTLTSGFSAEVIASISEAIDPQLIKKPPKRVTLPNAPAPTSNVLEEDYYIKTVDVVEAARTLFL